MLPEKRDLIGDGLDRLKTQWRDKPVIEGLLISFLREIQSLEDTADFLKNLSINNSTGDDLDRIGRLWNVARVGMSDEEYRIAILAYVSSIDPDISPEGIMEALRAFGQTDQVQLHEHFPAFTQTYMGEGFVTDMYTTLRTLVPAATGTSMFIDDNGDSLVFIEEARGSRILVTDEEKGILLDVDEFTETLWGVTTFIGEENSEYFSEFAEEGDIEFHPLAEELNRGIGEVLGVVLTDDDEEVVDDQGNPVLYRSLVFKD